MIKGKYRTVEKFMENLIPIPITGCLLWGGYWHPRGYGRVYAGGKPQFRSAHVVLWELLNGPKPEGMDICHACDVRPCCNPVHLFLGTRKQNMEDMVRKGRWKPNRTQTKSHCKRGHELSGSNLKPYPKNPNWRVCRVCINLIKRQSRMKLRGERHVLTATN